MYISKIDLGESIATIQNDSLYFNNEIYPYLTPNKDLIIVYFINSECSTCIGDFTRFMSALGKSGLNNSLYGVLNIAHKDQLEYYINKTLGSNATINKPILITCNQMYPYGNEESFNNVFIMHKNKVVRKWIFSDNTLIID